MFSTNPYEASKLNLMETHVSVFVLRRRCRFLSPYKHFSTKYLLRTYLKAKIKKKLKAWIQKLLLVFGAAFFVCRNEINKEEETTHETCKVRSSRENWKDSLSVIRLYWIMQAAVRTFAVKSRDAFIHHRVRAKIWEIVHCVWCVQSLFSQGNRRAGNFRI